MTVSDALSGTVYVVDDDAAVLGSLQFLLETDGFAVRTFRNATALLNASGAPGAVSARYSATNRSAGQTLRSQFAVGPRPIHCGRGSAAGGASPGSSAAARARSAVPNQATGSGGGSSPAASDERGATGSSGAPQGTGSPDRGPAARPSCTDDPSGDLDSSGDAPSYADVTGGCLRAESQRLSLEARTIGVVPARMPDRDTHLSYGFELTTPSGSTGSPAPSSCSAAASSGASSRASGAASAPR